MPVLDLAQVALDLPLCARWAIVLSHQCVTYSRDAPSISAAFSDAILVALIEEEQFVLLPGQHNIGVIHLANDLMDLGEDEGPEGAETMNGQQRDQSGVHRNSRDIAFSPSPSGCSAVPITALFCSARGLFANSRDR